jgi:hypothetical protein
MSRPVRQKVRETRPGRLLDQGGRRGLACDKARGLYKVGFH